MKYNIPELEAGRDIVDLEIGKVFYNEYDNGLKDEFDVRSEFGRSCYIGGPFKKRGDDDKCDT